MSGAASPAGRSLGRSAFTGALSALAAAAIVLASLAGTIHAVILSPDALSSVVSPIGANPRVRAAIADGAAAEVVAALDIEGRAKGLIGSPIGDLAAPVIAAAARARLSTAIEDELASPAFADGWQSTVRAAAATAVEVLRGDTSVVATSGGVVYLNALPAIAGTLESLRSQGLLGATSPLPDLSDPSASALAMIASLSIALGLVLPPDFGQVAIVKTAALGQAQAAVALIEALALPLVLAAIGLSAAVVAVAVDRRRAVVLVGLSAALALGAVPPLLELTVGGASASLAAPGMAVVATALLDAVVNAVSWPLRAVSAACLVAVLAALGAGIAASAGSQPRAAARRTAAVVLLLLAAGFAIEWAMVGPDAALLATATVTAAAWTARHRLQAVPRG